MGSVQLVHDLEIISIGYCGDETVASHSGLARDGEVEGYMFVTIEGDTT